MEVEIKTCLADIKQAIIEIDIFLPDKNTSRPFNMI